MLRALNEESVIEPGFIPVLSLTLVCNILLQSSLRLIIKEYLHEMNGTSKSVWPPKNKTKRITEAT